MTDTVDKNTDLQRGGTSAISPDDRLEIVTLTLNLGLLTDLRDWTALERLFTDPVEVDYTSLNGGDPIAMTPAALVGGWRAALGHLSATQHLITGQLVTFDGDHASCTANVLATHLLVNRTGDSVWTLGGRYDFSLHRTTDEWRIEAMTLYVLWTAGNQHIMRPPEYADGD